MKYLRRKRDSKCFHPSSLSSPTAGAENNGQSVIIATVPLTQVLVQHCECVFEDFECDYGYERVYQRDDMSWPYDSSLSDPLGQIILTY